jgi:hypothetical protein
VPTRFNSSRSTHNTGVAGSTSTVRFVPFILRVKVAMCEIFILNQEKFNKIKTDYSELKEVLKKVSSDKTEKMAELVIEGIVI